MATVIAATLFDPAKLEVRRKALICDLRCRVLVLNTDEANSAAAYYL